MEQVTLKLDNFEGPLSLLYHLIEKNKVDIYDIPIFEITKQYMDVIYGSDIKDMEFISGFIVMASTLMEIKSKMLLPRQKNDEGEEIDPREELVNRLVEYKKYREAAEKLREKENLYAVRLFKEPDPVLSIIKSDFKSSVEGFMDGVTFDDIINAFKRVMAVKEMRTDNIKSGFKSVSHDEFTIEEKMKLIVGLGNPGSEYTKTRHNIGFSLLDSLAKIKGFSFDKDKFNGMYAEYMVNGEKVILVKPLSYMNLSGGVVYKYINFFKIDIKDLLIIQDDLDMTMG